MTFPFMDDPVPPGHGEPINPREGQFPNYDPPRYAEHPCPNGHGPMTFYEGLQDDESLGEPDFYECSVCGHQEGPDA